MGPLRRPNLSTVVVVMGVSGVGKSTVMAELARLTGWRTAEGDDFHPPANVEKMRGGAPLTDEERMPWLAAIADRVGAQETAGVCAIVTCSALRRRYRDVLRAGHPSVWFAHLCLAQPAIEARLDRRTDHFLPPTLLPSQFAILEALEPGEPGSVLDAFASPDQSARRIVKALAGEQG